MGRVYSIEVSIAATAYVRADSEEEARAKAKELGGTGLELPEYTDGVEISGRSFDDPDLPEVSLSPSMTIVEINHEDECELVHDDEDEEEG